jgi:hypothetical protein
MYARNPKIMFLGLIPDARFEYMHSTGYLACESRFELARILLADFDPTVTGIAAQPFQAPDRPAAHVRCPLPSPAQRHGSQLTLE